MPTDLLSASEAAREVSRLTGLKVSVRTFNRWAASGRVKVSQQLPGDKGARLFTRREIARFAKVVRADRCYDEGAA